MNPDYSLNPHVLARYLQKEPKNFTKEDIIRYVRENDIEMINFRYPGADGRLKTLNFIINSIEHLDNILTCGERVDGSSLFPYIEAGSSDLYVLPRYRTAFLNPFSQIPAVDILCSFYTKDGKPLEMSPEYTMRKAHEALRQVTGMEYEVMGELEYYVVTEVESYFDIPDQRGYHESMPFCKGQELRELAMKYIASTGGLIKYGHSEVGNFTLDCQSYEQNEIEFLPTRMEDAADQLMIAKWILRTLAHEYGVDLTFAPKITVGKAGSGLHIHTRLSKDGKNAMVENGKLTDNALKAIAGYLELAPSLTAFGNTNPTSYLRLVPHQEAPTNICWGDRNRSVLVRVPLGWTSGATHMMRDANPLERVEEHDYSNKQTVEFRCPDGSADVYLLIAGLAVAARHGFEMKNALQYARERYVDVNIFDDANKAIADRLSHLPTSCHESALCLEQQRTVYEEYGVFAPALIDGLIASLRKFNDADLREQLKNEDISVEELVEKYYYCG
ncbi:glutamine synthetase family protein [Butyricimonas sp.]|uniref:glutamine synthetase family protein n=1 Tax=Butyricimonas sp. TaxID=1969738 RepID=UPI0025B90382|nr:glutamine synthetase family protein [Butyricimonas sp.]